MEFANIVDLVQIFANEHGFPGDIVLIVGNYPELKNIFEFINCESFIIDTFQNGHTDIVIHENCLPFENQTFDLIIELKKLGNLLPLLKPEGNILTVII
jgi:hypothetical protein